MSKKVLITGATGMVGGIVLQKCLDSEQVSEIVSFVRKPSGLNSNKLTEVIHNDFTNYTSLSDYFKGVDVAYFCLGVYTGSVNREEFRKITVDYTIEFAKALTAHSPDATFCLLSGAGADRTEKSRMMFAKDKGIAENVLFSLQLGAVYSFRPAYIYPVTPRKEPNFTYRLTRSLYPVLKRLMPNGVITSEQLASVIFKVGLLGYSKGILENRDIKNFE